MFFITLMMVLSSNGNHFISNILYTNLGCTFLMSIYIIVGYFYHNTFYRQLNELVKSDRVEVLAAIPKPQTYEQKLYMHLIKKLHMKHLEALEKLHDEKKDHQDFIMSWIHEVKLPITASRLLIKNSTG